jgi:hypothetical protein
MAPPWGIVSTLCCARTACCGVVVGYMHMLTDALTLICDGYTITDNDDSTPHWVFLCLNLFFFVLFPSDFELDERVVLSLVDCYPPPPPPIIIITIIIALFTILYHHCLNLRRVA